MKTPSQSIVALALLVAAAARGQEVATKAADQAAQQDARVQQYVQMLQPTMWRELDFVRLVCDLKPEQRPKIKAATEAAVQQAAKSMVTFRQGQREVDKVSSAQAIRDAIAKSLKETLPAEQFAHYSEEAATRASAHKRATIHMVVGQMDSVLFLSAEQRDKIVAALDQNWKDEWEQWQMVNQFAGQYFPTVPDQFVTPHLNADQHLVWNGLQKISIGPGGPNNIRRPADDGWWDDAAKAKAKAKGKAAKKGS